MIRLSLAEVAQLTGGELTGGADGTAVVTGGVTLDSRTVTAGDLFVAFAGERVDGHDFLGAAAAAGAVGPAGQFAAGQLRHLGQAQPDHASAFRPARTSRRTSRSSKWCT